MAGVISVPVLHLWSRVVVGQRAEPSSIWTQLPAIKGNLERQEIRLMHLNVNQSYIVSVVSLSECFECLQ